MNDSHSFDHIRVALADDHPVVRSGLRMMLEREENLHIVGESSDGTEALALIREAQPDVALIDIEMPGMTGLDILREIRAENLETRCIVLTLYDDSVVYHKAVQNGARGYILKDSPPQDILRSIRCVARGELFLGHADKQGERRNAHPRAAGLMAVDGLTSCERRVLRMIAENKSTRTIAEELCVSTRTIDSHRANICSKLGEHGSYGLIRFAVEHRMYL